MKNYLYIIFCVCSISCNGLKKELQETDSFKNKYEFQTNNDYHSTNVHLEDSYENDNDQKYINYDEEYIGNPDFDAIIERPCRIFDLNCIRRFFAEHSKCKIRRGQLPSTLPISQETLYYSRVNSSAITVNFRMNGLRNTRIEEFYINRRTNMMVFSIQIRGFTKTSPSVYFVTYRNGSEPVVLLTEVEDIFPPVTYTAIIPNVENLQLDKAEITAYADGVATFIVGPEVANNTNPTVTQSLVELFADLSTAIQELMLTDSYFYLPAYIQYNICDFSLTNL